MYEFLNVTSTNTLPDVCSFPPVPSACILRSNQLEHVFHVSQFTGIPWGSIYHKLFIEFHN